MSPRRVRSGLIAAAISFSLTFGALGYMLGVSTTQVSKHDLLVGRAQSYDRGQCTVDLLLLPYAPEVRLQKLGGDAHLPGICRRAQQIVRPHDPLPDVGTHPIGSG